MRPGTSFTLVGSGSVRLRFLGADESGRAVLAVRSRGVISPCNTFPAGRDITVTRQRPAADTYHLRVHAFEFGYYATLDDFERRATQCTRPKAVRTGILTCETQPCI
jgi:hypothetical protein